MYVLSVMCQTLDRIFMEEPSTWAKVFSSITSQVLYLLNTLKHANVNEKVTRC